MYQEFGFEAIMSQQTATRLQTATSNQQQRFSLDLKNAGR